MRTLKRYPHLYITLLKMNFSMLFSYRANFINSALSSIGWGIISIVSMFILTSKTSSIYGWNRNELLLLTGVYSVVIGIFHTIFSRNFDRFSLIIHRGELDSILLKPLDSQFLLSFTLFNSMSLTRFLIGVGFTIYMLFVLHITLELLSVFAFLAGILLGVVLLYAIWFCGITITIWVSNLDNLKGFLYQINNLGRYPSEIIYKTGNIFLFLLLPLTYVASIPVKQILRKGNSLQFALLFLFTTGLFLFSRSFWKFALRFYTSANS